MASSTGVSSTVGSQPLLKQDNAKDMASSHQLVTKGSSPKQESDIVHLKNDSGSFDIRSSNSIAAQSSINNSAGAASSPQANHVTILVSSNGSPHPCHPPPRSTSAASVHSDGHCSIGSSSSSCDLSHKDMLEHLVAELGSSSTDKAALESNAVVKQLLEHVVTLKLELEELKQENCKLKQVRSTMDDELHTLTENLFEEAYKMVDTAKEEKGLAVKKLADAAGKIDAMETEMSALKNLLQTPGSEGGSKSPSTHTKHRKPSVKKALKKITHKVKGSSSQLNGGATPPPLLLEHKNEVKGACLVEGEMMPNDFAEFNAWLNDLSAPNHPYLSKVEDTDVKPCLTFKNKELSDSVMSAVRNNDLLMESLGPCSADEKRDCALSVCEEVCCTHRMRLGDSGQWFFISQQCRDRIAAACDFYMYIGHIEKGILKLEASQLYWQVCRLRALMTLARLTLQLPPAPSS